MRRPTTPSAPASRWASKALDIQIWEGRGFPGPSSFCHPKCQVGINLRRKCGGRHLIRLVRTVRGNVPCAWQDRQQRTLDPGPFTSSRRGFIRPGCEPRASSLSRSSWSASWRGLFPHRHRGRISPSCCFWGGLKRDSKNELLITSQSFFSAKRAVVQRSFAEGVSYEIKL